MARQHGDQRGFSPFTHWLLPPRLIASSSVSTVRGIVSCATSSWVRFSRHCMCSCTGTKRNEGLTKPGVRSGVFQSSSSA